MVLHRGEPRVHLVLFLRLVRGAMEGKLLVAPQHLCGWGTLRATPWLSPGAKCLPSRAATPPLEAEEILCAG